MTFILLIATIVASLMLSDRALGRNAGENKQMAFMFSCIGCYLFLLCCWLEWQEEGRSLIESPLFAVKRIFDAIAGLVIVSPILIAIWVVSIVAIGLAAMAFFSIARHFFGRRSKNSDNRDGS